MLVCLVPPFAQSRPRLKLVLQWWVYLQGQRLLVVGWRRVDIDGHCVEGDSGDVEVSELSPVMRPVLDDCCRLDEARARGRNR